MFVCFCKVWLAQKAGRVRFGYMADNEDELVSDYFLSYGQAFNDHCLYDMESDIFGNEMRFLNSAHNMGVPANVRIEGRVIDILFLNLPCVIATR